MTHTQLVSVVMPSFNQAQFITQSINSVLDQSYAEVELIVSDGGSQDGTVDILDEIARRDDRLRWWSETDNGPAHALNKALKAARGTIVGWLNSDDLYAPGAIEAALNVFDNEPDTIMLYGNGQHVDADANVLGDYPTRRPEVGVEAFSQGCFICQPSVFFRRSLYARLGPLNETLGTTFDYEYWLRAFTTLPERIGFIDRLMASSRLHDACITMNQRRGVALEGVMLCWKYLGRSEPHWLITYFEEMYRLETEERGFSDLSAHCLETINLAADYLSLEDVMQLRTSFS